MRKNYKFKIRRLNVQTKQNQLKTSEKSTGLELEAETGEARWKNLSINKMSDSQGCGNSPVCHLMCGICFNKGNKL